MNDLLLPLAAIAILAAPASPPAPSTVVFVCEHGAAKSMLAAAVFNDLAERRGSALRAVSRGLTPDAEIAPAVAAGLAADGIAVPSEPPRRLADEDVARALRVVALGTKEDAALPASVETWQVPAVSDGYAAARDAIVERVIELLDSLEPTVPR